MNITKKTLAKVVSDEVATGSKDLEFTYNWIPVNVGIAHYWIKLCNLQTGKKVNRDYIYTSRDEFCKDIEALKAVASELSVRDVGGVCDAADKFLKQ